MTTLAINRTLIEYQETVRLQEADPRSYGPEDFEAFLEQARELKTRAEEKAARISEDIRQAKKETEDEENPLKAADKFRAGRKSLIQSRLEVFQAQTILPQNVREQISRSLMGSGQADQGLRGWDLTGSQRPTAVLKGMLQNIRGEGSLWHLDRDAVPSLGRIFLASGADSEAVSGVMAKLAKGPLTLDRVLKAVSQVESDLAVAQSMALPPDGQSEAAETSLVSAQTADFFSQTNFSPSRLTVTDEALGAMGQYFLSLGLSAEAVKAVTSDLKPGQNFSDQTLRNLLSQLDEPLAPCLNDGDTASLFLALKSMGAGNGNLNTFAQYLTGTPEAKIDDLLGFLAVLEQPQPKLSGTNLVSDVQSLIASSSKEAELTKTPLFNEIILKLASLGDRELNDDFSELSPALQALRGGISGLRSSEGQGFDGQGGNHKNNREQEQNRLAAAETQSPLMAQGLDQSGFTQAMAGEWGGYGTRESLARQLESKLIYSARQGVRRLKMDLDPESLGRLDVELKVKDDKLTAHIRAESAEAFEALEKEISTLKASLKEAGLEMNLTLSFNGQEEKDRHFSRSDKHYGAGRIEETSRSGPEEPWPPVLTADRNRLLDRVV